MFKRSIAVLSSIVSLYVLWLLFLPATLQRFGVVSLTVLAALVFVAVVLTRREEAPKSMAEVLRGVDAEGTPELVRRAPAARPGR